LDIGNPLMEDDWLEFVACLLEIHNFSIVRCFCPIAYCLKFSIVFTFVKCFCPMAYCLKFTIVNCSITIAFVWNSQLWNVFLQWPIVWNSQL
jgi:hypothetical protein